MFVDTHAHFDHLASVAQRAAVIERAVSAGVVGVVAVGGSAASSQSAIIAGQEYPELIGVAVGFDREQVGKSLDLSWLRDVAQLAPTVAIGEIGLDYHFTDKTKREQRVLFQQMLDLAATLDKVVIVHSRDAEADTVAMLKDWTANGMRAGVVHCFTGSPRFAEQLLEIGFYLGFSGILTFKNAESLRQIARALPLDRILVETDSPYLAPVPYRGHVNEPANVRFVAECIAKIRDDTLDHIAHSTAENAKRLFKKPWGKAT